MCSLYSSICCIFPKKHAPHRKVISATQTISLLSMLRFLEQLWPGKDYTNVVWKTEGNISQIEHFPTLNENEITDAEDIFLQIRNILLKELFLVKMKG